MKLFNCVVAVTVDKSGNPLHTVVREGVTENELTLLRSMHGYQSVTKVEEVGEIDRDNRLDYLMLARKYGDPTFSQSGVALMRKMFNVELHEYDSWLSQVTEEEEEARQAAAAKRAQEEARRVIGTVMVSQSAPAPAAPQKTSMDVAEAALSASKPAAKVATKAVAAELE